MWISRRRHQKMGIIGPERLTNGDFSASGANWNVVGADGTHIVTFDGTTCRFQSGTTTPQLIVTQNAVMVVGRRYQITVVVSAAALPAGIKSDAFTGGPLLAPGTPGTYVVQGFALTTQFSFTRNAANVDMTIDSISIRQIGP